MTDKPELSAAQRHALTGLRNVWQKVHDGEITSFTFVGVNSKGDIVPFSHVDTMADLLNLLGAGRVMEGDMVVTLREHVSKSGATSTPPTKTDPVELEPDEPAVD